MPVASRQPRTFRMIINEMIERVNNDTQRLRVLEQTSDSLISRTNMLEQAVLQQRKEMQKLLLEISDKISLLEEGIVKSESTLKEVINHMKKLVTESQLKEIQSLVDIYNPVKSSFVTREELEKALRKIQDKPRKSK